jgi:hypothetical protein
MQDIADKESVMKIPIRMIGLVTTFFWIFLIAFLVSAVYSIKDLQFDFGEPQTSVTSDNEILFSLPITMLNNGYYNIGAFNLTTKVFDENDFAIAHHSTFVPVIERGVKTTLSHNITIDADGFLQSEQRYLFNDTELTINQIVGMKLAEAIPVAASTNFSMPWGAPLYDFTVGEVECELHNITHVKATVVIHFENHALFDLNGRIQLYMYSGGNELIGGGQKAFEAPQNSLYESSMELYVSVTEKPENGYMEIQFVTSLFSYGPLVIPYG